MSVSRKKIIKEERDKNIRNTEGIKVNQAINVRNTPPAIF